MYRSICHLLLILAFPTTMAPLNAVTVPHVFGDHMVLQSGQPVPIWGWGNAGETIIVRFAGQERRTIVATADGHWMVRLEPLAVASQATELTISGAELLVFKDVLVGEVWLCSGQSNMQKPLGTQRGQVPTLNYRAELAAADVPLMRLLKVKIARPHTPARDFDLTTRDHEDYPWKGWVVCTPSSLDEVKFSAVGYFFGRLLHRELGIPIGLIDCTAGGSRIESWTTPDGFAAMPSLAAFAAATRTPGTQVEGADVSTFFYGMIRPLVPCALRGVLWYQGESNVYNNDGLRYADKMAALILGWRQAWGRELPFYYVQLPPLLYSVTRKQVTSAEALPLLREAQTAILRLPKTGMVVTTDLVTNLKDIHPQDKKPVGERLARWALAHDYGRTEVEPSGPLFRAMEVKEGRAVLHFDHCGGGLVSKDGKPLTGFVIAGADGVFVPAETVIADDLVSVSSPQVPHPVAVRFCWDEAAQPNFFNTAGLPAVPFRTDHPAYLHPPTKDVTP